MTRKRLELFPSIRRPVQLDIAIDKQLAYLRGAFLGTNRGKKRKRIIIALHTDINFSELLKHIGIIGNDFQIFPRCLNIIDIALFTEQLRKRQRVLPRCPLDITILKYDLSIARARLDILAVGLDHRLQDLCHGPSIVCPLTARETFLKLSDGFVLKA